MSQHDYEPAPTDYSTMLAWMTAVADQDAQVQALREQLDQQYRDAGIGDGK